MEREIGVHYDAGVERDRLTTWGRLEAARTRELLDRYLPAPPATVLDIGGAEGAYALPLARAGYAVRLLDPHPPHVVVAAAASAAAAGTSGGPANHLELAGRGPAGPGEPGNRGPAGDGAPGRGPDGSRKPAGAPLAEAVVGDARELPWPDRCADAALLFGPLYHLVDPADRRRALVEARRVLRPGGRLMVAAISRFASAYDGVARGWLDDPLFARIVAGDLQHGRHHNPDPTGRPEWFTLAYFHRPDELRDEVAAAGFTDVRVLAVEGIGAACPDPGAVLDDPARAAVLLSTIRRLESEPSVLGASPHLMAVATAAVG